MSDVRKRRSKKAGILPREIIADERTFRSWLSDHQTQLGYGFGAIILILVIIGGFLWTQGRNVRAANEDLAAALRFHWTPAQAGSPEEAPRDSIKLEQAIGRFQDVAQRHENSPQGLTASYYQAGVLFDLGRYPEAASLLENVRGADEALFFHLNGPLLLARCQEAQGDYGKAVESLNEVKERSARDDLEALLLMDIARCSRLMGDNDRAIALYIELEERFPDTVFAHRAGKIRASLGAADREEL
ncbi:MAG: tetratricopeptide repeat protein [Proteobacteria bacterium]|nr:tetratricopeptide repeat protein [Pseudomonadota bacterium]